MKNILYVRIMGHEYPVEATTGDELYVNRLAQFVEQKMLEIKEESNVIDSYKLAVMAAMNISDELFRLQEGKGSSSRDLEQKTESLMMLLDQTLAQNKTPTA